MSACYTSSCSNFNVGTTDQQISYTGTNVTLGVLTICASDTLAQVESVILQTLTNYSTGVGISIPNINLTTGSCATLFANCISCCNGCTDLNCLMGCYYNAFCTLYTSVSTIQNEFTSISGPYNTACLSNVNSSSTIGAIIQEMIVELCTAESNITALQTSFNTLNSGVSTTIGNFLLNAITTCSGTSNITKSGTGATASIQFQGFVPIGGIIIYNGSLSNFSNGLGNTGGPMCGWAIADGRNNTLNMMGQTPVGLTNTGGSLPVNATGLAVNIIGATGGEVKHTLLSSEIPSVGVSASGANTLYIDMSNFNTDRYKFGGDGYAIDNPCPPNDQRGGSPIQCTTPSIAVSGTISVSGSTAGGGGSHNNMQPYTGVVYIQRIS